MNCGFLSNLRAIALGIGLAGLAALPAFAIDADVLLTPAAKRSVPAQELNCLAEAVYFEARGESELGQLAVAQVVVNRTGSQAYPRSICGVVYQNQHKRNACQFSFACDGLPEVKSEAAAWQKAKHIAYRIAGGGEVKTALLRTATHYHATYVSPSWAKKMTRLSKIGSHIFYREDR
ncbi:MAG TPA: cell wall hydrolase [Devosia sp.]|nr:cell wall hydrolase [Devosia sp.]